MSVCSIPLKEISRWQWWACFTDRVARLGLGNTWKFGGWSLRRAEFGEMRNFSGVWCHRVHLPKLTIFSRGIELCQKIFNHQLEFGCPVHWWTQIDIWHSSAGLEQPEMHLRESFGIVSFIQLELTVFGLWLVATLNDSSPDKNTVLVLSWDCLYSVCLCVCARMWHKECSGV